jgi:hypothetical protein
MRPAARSSSVVKPAAASSSRSARQLSAAKPRFHAFIVSAVRPRESAYWYATPVGSSARAKDCSARATASRRRSCLPFSSFRPFPPSYTTSTPAFSARIFKAPLKSTPSIFSTKVNMSPPWLDEKQ